MLTWTMDIGADQTLLAVRGKSRINYRKPVAMHPVKFALVPNLLYREAVHTQKVSLGCLYKLQRFRTHKIKLRN